MIQAQLKFSFLYLPSKITGCKLTTIFLLLFCIKYYNWKKKKNYFYTARWVFHIPIIGSHSNKYLSLIMKVFAVLRNCKRTKNGSLASSELTFRPTHSPTHIIKVFIFNIYIFYIYNLTRNKIHFFVLPESLSPLLSPYAACMTIIPS